MNNTRAWFLVLAVIALAPPATAQETAPTVPFVDTVDVEVVNIEVQVTDKEGKAIVGLNQGDFELRVDGQPTEISYFYAAAAGRTTEITEPVGRRRGRHFEPLPEDPGVAPSDQRLHVAIVVDNAHIKASNRRRAFHELRRFLDTRLPEDALVTVVSLEPELRFHADFLSDRAAIAEILGELEEAADRPRSYEIEKRQILGELDSTGRVYNRDDYATGGVTPDAMIIPRIRGFAEDEFQRNLRTLESLSQVVKSLAGVPGRKALLHLSDGIANRPGEDLFLAWSYRFGDGTPAAQGYRSAGLSTDYFREIGRFDLMPQFEALAELANASRVTWYAIDAESDHASTARSAATRGGVASEVLDALEANVREPAELTATLTGGRRLQVVGNVLDLGVVANDFSTYYSLGFTPPTNGGDDTPRPHKIEVKVGGKDLVVRHRETWTPKSKDERTANAVHAALLYGTASNPLGVTLTAGKPERRDDGSFVLPVEIAIPLANLVLLPSGDVHALQLSLFVTSQDERGNPRGVQKMPFGAAIPDDKLEEALADSVRTTLPMVVRPGDRRMALGIRDEIAAAESFVTLDLDL